MIAILKYNAGNVASVENAINRLGHKTIVTDDAALLQSAEKVIFPGVGEASSAMRYLKEKGLDAVIQSLQQPVLGICLGMQLASIEFARNVAQISKAHSQEFDPEPKDAIVHFMSGQDEKIHKGGTMRLGAYPCVLKKGSISQRLYEQTEISERHRHRLEFNNEYRGVLESKGFQFAGTSPDGNLVEVIELKDHPFFVGVQYHPEFLSKPSRPHPLFKGLVAAGLAAKKP